MLIERAAVPRVAPFLLYLGFIAVADLLARAGWSADQLRWLYGVKIAVVLTALLYWRREYGELPARPPGRGLALLSVAVGVVVLVLWLNLHAGWMKIGGSAGFDPTRDGRIDWSLALMRVAGAALVVPVMEELFWRSYLLRWITQADFLRLDPARIGWRGFAVTALLFGIEHDLWFAGVVAGAAYGWLYWYSRNLWAPVLAHAVTNGLLGVWIIATNQWSYW